jgi:hypothetical protein
MVREKPVRTDGDQHDDYVETHPSYGMIGAFNITSHPGQALFGSDFTHDHFVQIRISPAKLRRGHASDWIGASRDPYIEVNLSEAQWARFVSTMNRGDGVACTVSAFNGVAIPGIEPLENRRAQFNTEVADTLQDAVRAIDDVLGSGKLSKADRARIEKARQELTSNLGFVAKQFDEHAEETIEQAKTEIEAHIQLAIQRAGIDALSAGTILQLQDDTDA